jgi:GNAT superfamily N-acetyltransferase
MTSTVYEIKHAQNDAEILGCFDLLKILRPHLEKESFVETVHRQTEEGYHLIFIADNEGVKSAAGYRIAHFLAWGKVLYLDDLITLPEARGIGFGTHLLKHLKGVAEEHGCKGIHLDTDVQRDDAHRLYLNLGLHINSLHMSMDLE